MIDDEKCLEFDKVTDGLFIVKTPWSDDDAHYRNPYHFIDAVVGFAENGACPLMRNGELIVDSLTFAQGQSDIEDCYTCKFTAIAIPEGETRPIPAKDDGDMFNEGITVVATLFTPEPLTLPELTKSGADAILTIIGLGDEALAADLYGDTQCHFVKFIQCVVPELDNIRCDAWSGYGMWSE